MYRALSKLGEDKPIIVSMGDLAASGGYYVSAAGETILCDEPTLTGSIGIFSGKFAIRGLLDKIGVNPVSWNRGANADLFGMTEPWSETERTTVFAQITYLYELFLKQVSTGRGMARDDVDKVGQGHIWSGKAAVKNKLCDRTGGIMDALDLARDKVGLDSDDDYTIATLPTGDIFSPISPGMGVSADVAELERMVRPYAGPLGADASARQVYEAYAPIRLLVAPLRPALDLAVTFDDGEALALMPFTVELR
jgi:signal peptide peptidase SppA